MKRTSIQVFRAVVYALTLREMQGRFGRARMGAMWTLFEPIAHLVALTLIMVYIRGRTIPGIDYPVFLLVSLTPFLLYKNIALRMMLSMEANKALFAYKQIQPFSSFMGRVVVECVLSTTVFILAYLTLTWIGMSTTIAKPAEWVLMLFLGLFFAIGLGLVLAAIATLMPESKFLIRLLFMPLYLISGVIIPPSSYPSTWLPILMLNPFMNVLELIRSNIFPYYRPADGTSLSYVLECTLVLLFLGMAAYRLLRYRMMAI
ncbi:MULTISPECIES: ABC transporter permease [Bordetella]|nr:MULTISPECIES: ABC transporter permease [Bordetella]